MEVKEIFQNYQINEWMMFLVNCDILCTKGKQKEKEKTMR